MQYYAYMSHEINTFNYELYVLIGLKRELKITPYSEVDEAITLAYLGH
jgi:hypothetical protein